MQAVVTKRDLVRILARCQGVADKKSTMPILGNVLVEVSAPDQLRLAATDLYLGVSGTIPAEVEKGGSAAVGARDLFERVRMMPDGKLSISVGPDSAMTLKAFGQPRRYTLKGIPGAEFPTLPQPAETATLLELGTEALSELITKTHFSIAADDTRLHLNSALFQWDGDKIRMVTTDGHRLSKMEIEALGKTASASMLIPLKGIGELKRLCDEAKAEGQTRIQLVQNGPNAFFRLPGLQLSIKLVEAQFPPYQQVIPSSSSHRVAVSRALMAEALRAVSVAANDRTGGVKLSLGDNVLGFSSESSDGGDGFDELAVEYSGAPLTVGFNASYILQVLSSIEQDEVVLGVGGELDPATLQPAVQAEGTHYLAVIMPMRI
jgi:DNA polymerase III subunit beta